MIDQSIQADLRDYFNAVAEIRPADDELARALAATGRVRPRGAWRAELAETVTSLRRPAALGLRIAVTVGLLLLAAALLALGFAVATHDAPLTPFEGRWISHDIGDDSEMVLVVSGGETATVRYEDSFASGCADHGDANTHWIAVGAARIHERQMEVTFPSGGCTSWQIGEHEETLVHHPDVDVLTDTAGNVWYRPR